MGLELNMKRTKVMATLKVTGLTIDDHGFCLLGSVINNKGSSCEEEAWKVHQMSRQTKARIVQAFLWLLMKGQTIKWGQVLMALNFGVGEDLWEDLGQQMKQTIRSLTKPGCISNSKPLRCSEKMKIKNLAFGLEMYEMLIYREFTDQIS